MGWPVLAMSAMFPSSARLALAPAVVYFWGPVRSHVNRVAALYARRIQAEPVWLEVSDPRAPSEVGSVLVGPGSDRTFQLRAGADVQIARPSGASHLAAGTPRPANGDLEGQVGSLLTFPSVVHSALAAAEKSGRPGAFVLSNIDRLQHLSPMFGHHRSDGLFEAFRRSGIVLVLTSEGLLPLPHLGLECAFEVSSAPDEEWFESEIRPGVPVSCCGSCSGAIDGGYASCGPEFRSACPVLNPFAVPTA